LSHLSRLVVASLVDGAIDEVADGAKDGGSGSTSDGNGHRRSLRGAMRAKLVRVFTGTPVPRRHFTIGTWSTLVIILTISFLNCCSFSACTCVTRRGCDEERSTALSAATHLVLPHVQSDVHAGEQEDNLKRATF
jgi:hypothetical protein